MIDKYFEWNIDGVQANEVLDGAEISTIIDKSNYKDIFINKDLLEFIKSNEDSIATSFSYNRNFLIMNHINLSYRIKDNKYTISYNYKDIFNNILKKLNMNEVVTVSEVRDIEDYKKLESEIKSEIRSQKEVREHDGIHEEDDRLINELYDNLPFIIKSMCLIEGEIAYYVNNQINEERILRENHKALMGAKNKNISWKNLMYYTACKALEEFKFNDDIRYYRYAKNYYKNVSKDSKGEYPNGMTVDGEFFDHHHSNFNRKFLSVQRHKFNELLVRLDIEDKDDITRRQTLKNGKGIRVEITDENPKERKKIDYSKINAGLQRKITFYKGLTGKSQGIIKALDTDVNYIGYVLNNNYVIFDKFYEVSKDGTKVTPAYSSAVYIVTLDVLEACDYDRSKIRKYIRENHDYKAFRYNHTDVDSYQKRINEVLDYQDISTTKFKELKLRNENKKNN